MPVQRYSTPAIILHWLIALAIIVNVGLAWAWPNVPDEAVRPLINNHKSIGYLVLGLAVMRILWRVGHRPPPSPSGMAKWETGLSHATHVLLYVVIFALPISGWIFDSAWDRAAENPHIWFGLFEWPRLQFIMDLDPATKKIIHDRGEGFHEFCGKLLYGLFALHVVGALKHQFVDRQPELQRMWFGRRS